MQRYAKFEMDLTSTTGPSARAKPVVQSEAVARNEAHRTARCTLRRRGAAHSRMSLYVKTEVAVPAVPGGGAHVNAFGLWGDVTRAVYNSKFVSHTAVCVQLSKSQHYKATLLQA